MPAAKQRAQERRRGHVHDDAPHARAPWLLQGGEVAVPAVMPLDDLCAARKCSAQTCQLTHTTSKDLLVPTRQLPHRTLPHCCRAASNTLASKFPSRGVLRQRSGVPPPPHTARAQEMGIGVGGLWARLTYAQRCHRVLVLAAVTQIRMHIRMP